MRLEDLNWMDVENYLQKDDRLMIVLGACEQHGYLSLLTDVKIPLALADAASKQTGVLIAPPINVGSSPYFLSFPGTMSIKITTLMEVVEDMLRSGYSQGFHRFLFLNGHGGNEVVRARLNELVNELTDVKMSWYAWWMTPGVKRIAEKYNLAPKHGSWLEAFPFTRVADLPQDDKFPVHIPDFSDSARVREIIGDGSFGGCYQANLKVLDEVFNECLAEVIELLNFYS
jgi:creatinine amidohydrolase